MIERGRDELDGALAYAHEAARAYLGNIDERVVRGTRADDAARAYAEPLPARGNGAHQALELLVELSEESAIASAGPRFFHFVIGGATPAALAADWLTSTLDQNAFAWVSSPLASRLEAVSIDWLKELFGLPAAWGGVLTTGATTANVAALATARHWWGERHGVDVDQEGLAGLPRVPVLTSGYVHASAIKALAMLGIGRSSVQTFTADGHKWLNVPYDCGYAFVRDASTLARTFTLAASYLPLPPGDADPSFGYSGPESSRRARGIATWATLRAYGREGYRELVEKHLDLAQRLAAQVDEASDFELLAPARLSIVCFRYRPTDVPAAALDELNERLGKALLDDGRVFVGTTHYDGRVAFRPAIVNWRTSEQDVDLIVAVIRQLAKGVT